MTIAEALRGQRFRIGAEKDLQRQISEALTFAGLEHAREVKVAGGVIDFLVGDTGVEVKVSGSAIAIYRQVKGYADDPRIKRLVLVTARAMGMPKEINGKPVEVVGLGAAWF